MKNLIQQIPTWSIYSPEGTKVETLKHCFIVRMVLDLSGNIPAVLKARDGIVYQCVYTDFQLPQDLQNIKVIVSFQAHTYGNYAIIRNLGEPIVSFNAMMKNKEE